MKIKKSAIAPLLKQLKNIVPPKTAYDAPGVLIKDGNIIATNLEMTVWAAIPEDAEGYFVLPIKAIDLIERLSDEYIEITEKDNRISIKHKHGKSTFSTIKADDFPVQELDISQELIASLNGDILTQRIESVMFACSKDTTRIETSGVMFESDGANLNLAACDGCRLAWNACDYGGDFKAIVPKASLQKILALGLNGDVRISKANNRLYFQTETHTVQLALLSSKFIAYRSMFGAKPAAIIKVRREELIKSLSRCLASIGADKMECTVLSCPCGENVLTLKNRTATADFEEVLTMHENAACDMLIGFNTKYLIEALKASDSEFVELQYTASVSPVIIVDGNLKQLILPMKIKGKG